MRDKYPLPANILPVFKLIFHVFTDAAMKLSHILLAHDHAAALAVDHLYAGFNAHQVGSQLHKAGTSAACTEKCQRIYYKTGRSLLVQGFQPLCDLGCGKPFLYPLSSLAHQQAKSSRQRAGIHYIHTLQFLCGQTCILTADGKPAAQTDMHDLIPFLQILAEYIQVFSYADGTCLWQCASFIPVLINGIQINVYQILVFRVSQSYMKRDKLHVITLDKRRSYIARSVGGDFYRFGHFCLLYSSI